MDFDTLRYFLAVADELSFRRAAALCFVSQPALSRRIRELEREIGCQLLVRDSHSVALTAAGLRFRECAREMVRAADASIAELRLLRNGDRGGDAKLSSPTYRAVT